MKSEIEQNIDWVKHPRVVILGSGYIGNSINNYLADRGWMVSLLSSKTLNYHDKSVLNKHLCNIFPDVVINCSGFTGRPNVDEAESRKNDCWNLNVSSPLLINKICNNIGIKYVHISSGCIYTGYDKMFTEKDGPNFGLFDESSFYSKTKHAFELMSKDLGLTNKIIRIRMPVSPDSNPRSYPNKILNYDNLIDFKNSKTYIPDLCNFVENLLAVNTIGFWVGQDIYNVVNPDPLYTSEVTEIMEKAGKSNPKWKFVDVKSLNMKAPRSNCVLDGSKADQIYKMRNEIDILREVLA